METTAMTTLLVVAPLNVSAHLSLFSSLLVSLSLSFASSFSLSFLPFMINSFSDQIIHHGARAMHVTRLSMHAMHRQVTVQHVHSRGSPPFFRFPYNISSRIVVV